MTTKTTTDLQDFARQLHTWGASVTAIKHGTKRPAHKWQQWQAERQTRAELDGLPWRGAAAVGIVNGSGDFRVFDIDAIKDGDGRPVGPVPESVVIDLLTALGLPTDYQWSYRSGSGAGYGVVIRCAEPLPPDWAAVKGVYVGRPADGRPFGQLELRWATGQTVIYGAHPTGPGYQWRRLDRPFVPPAMRTAAQVVTAFTAIADAATAAHVPTAAPLPAGHANGTPSAATNGAATSATEKYAAAALAGAIRQVATAAPGDRNNTLFRQTAALAELVNGGILTRDEVDRAMTGAALDAGLAADETEATIKSAFTATGTTARTPKPSANGHRAATNGAIGQSGGPSGASGSGAAGATGQATGGQPAGGSAAKSSPIHSLSYRPEDGGIMDVWHTLHGDEWIYATGFEQWHAYTGTHWQADTGGYALRAQVVALMDMMNETARTLRAAADKAGDKEEVKRLTAYVDATKRTAARVASVEGLARLRRYVAADALDAADVLNLANGALDLGTLTLRPHDRRDLLTYYLPYAYDPAAVAPNWAIVLGRIEEETRDFLQEYAGYALTPDTRHELAIWLYGPPGRGASTLLTGLQAMLGPKAALIGLADIERNRFALANLPGKTLAVATEQPADYMAATHVLNALISGEPVTVDRKFKDAVTITPRAKLAWAMNELPRVKGAGNGVFRRVKVVTFPAIPEHERRPELKELVKTEAAGILNWALEGLKRLRARGRFIIPAAVETATQAFALQNDIPKVFIEERCDIGPGLSVGSKQLYNVYANWCEETGHKAQSMTSIADDWERLGFEKVKTAPGMVWRGVGLKP